MESQSLEDFKDIKMDECFDSIVELKETYHNRKESSTEKFFLYN
jgi:hypothetical protein